MEKPRWMVGLVLLILLASLIPWPQATAITPQDQTISITDTHDDLFITETGIGIDSQLCHILDPNMDVRSFLVFRELEINWWEPLENATLRFRTTAILDFDADSSVTVYGMRYSDLQIEGVLNPSWVLSAPLTSASVNVNTSQFYGQTWHEVNVTTIVEEVIRSYDWDGDGHAGTETGDAIGFIILGAEGYDTRWFIDYLYGTPSLAPQLVIHWNHEPPPPTGSGGLATFNGTYRGYHIWNVLSEWLNYSSFTLTNPDANIQNLNDTYFEYTTFYEDDDDYLRKSFSGSGQLNRKFGITYLVFKENTASESGSMILHWGISNITSSPWGPPYWGEGYSIATVQTTAAIEKLQIINWVNGQHVTHLDLHPWWDTANLPVTIWVDVNLDLDSGDYSVILYNDMEMTSVNQSTTGTFGAVPDASLMTTEFAIGPTISTTAFRDWESGLRLSSPEMGDTWTVTDENGTTINGDPCDTFECAKTKIDDILGTDPEDPNPPGETWTEGPGGETGAFTRFRMRLWFLAMGFGCVFGPVLFFAWKRPSGYYLFCGAIVMLIGLGLLLSIGQV